MNKYPESVDNMAKSAQGGPSESGIEVPSLDSLPTDEFLRVVGLRVRTQRSTMSMSRKRLAEVSGVSERYLAQLESGQGNMSIALLRKVTSAIGMSLGALLSAEVPEQGVNTRSAAESADDTSSSTLDTAHRHSSTGHDRHSQPGVSSDEDKTERKQHLVPEL